MPVLLGILSLLMNMRNNNGSSNNSYEANAKAFRDYWLDPEYSYQRSDGKGMFGPGFDSKEMFGPGFDYKV